MGIIVLYVSYFIGFLGWAFLLSYLFSDIFWGVTTALAIAAALVLYKVLRKKQPQVQERPQETLLDTAKREAAEAKEREAMRRAALAPKKSPESDSKPDPASGGNQ